MFKKARYCIIGNKREHAAVINGIQCLLGDSSVAIRLDCRANEQIASAAIDFPVRIHLEALTVL